MPAVYALDAHSGALYDKRFGFVAQNVRMIGMRTPPFVAVRSDRSMTSVFLTAQVLVACPFGLSPFVF